jgi:hypothetical protein
MLNEDAAGGTPEAGGAAPEAGSWITTELQVLLRKLKPKQRSTVLRLAGAKATGVAWDRVWGSEGVCSDTTRYGRYAHGEKLDGWRDDPDVWAAYQAAEAAALKWEEGRIGRGIQRAQLRLAEEAFNSVERLVALRDGAEADETRRKAANDILAMTVGRVHKLGIDQGSVDPFLELLRELRGASDEADASDEAGAIITAFSEA